MGKKTKKILGLILVGIMSLALSGKGAVAQEVDYYESLISQLEANSSYIPEDFVAESLTKGISPDRGASLASRYVPDLNALPDVRNQGSFGTCWAHSSIFLAEQSILRNNSSLSAREINYSELALAYFSFHSVVDPLGGTDGDRNFAGSNHDWLNDGGNMAYAANVLASWTGATAESKVPYSSATSSMTIDPKYAYDDEAHLQGSYAINLKIDSDAAKQALLDYGALGVSYYSENKSYYNSSTNSYYCFRSKDTNHAVAIVGWDDNYSKDNFLKDASGNGPEEDGAWLIRNSWGYNGAKTYSSSKYFWISYYDKSLGNAWAFEFERADSYDNNYQYDGAAPSYSYLMSNSVTAANVFEAGASDLGETLEAVSFSTGSSSVSYTIDIYKNPEVGNPESGSKVATKTGSTTFSGYYTVKLDTPVELAKGDTFSVVVKLSKANEYVSIRLENSSSSWYSAEATAKANQSYMKRSTGTWFDYGVAGDRNIRIKAFTKNKKSSVLPTTISITNVSNQKLYLESFNDFKLNVEVTPNNASTKFVFSSSDEKVATIDAKGQITALSEGSTTITVKSAVCDVAASFALKVNEPVYSVDISSENASRIKYGSEFNLIYETYPVSNKLMDEVEWTSSNESVVTVSNRGRVKAVGVGKADVTAKLHGSESKISLTVTGSIISINCTVNKDSTITVEWDEYEEYSQYYVQTLQGTTRKTEKTLSFDGKAKASAVIDRFKGASELTKVTVYVVAKEGSTSKGIDCYLGPWGTVTWVLDMGENNPRNVTEYSANDDKLTLYKPILPEGYEFWHWYLDKDYKTRAEDVYDVYGKETVDYTFYGKVTPIEYNIYYKDYKRFSNYSKLVHYYTIEDEIELVTPEYADGEEFEGWYLDKDYKTPIEKIKKGTTGDFAIYDKHHKWNKNAGKVTKKATCVEEGEIVYSCMYDGCTATKTETTPKLTTHSWDKGKTTKAATCTAKGVKTYTCTTEGCGETKTEDIAKTKHKSATELTPASTKKDGVIKEYCSLCKTTLSTTTIARAFIVCDETQKYTGKAITPVKVVDATGKAIANTNYTITYTNNKKVGMATAKIVFKGNYKDSPVTKTFYIAKADQIPAKVNNVKLVADKQGFTASWTKAKSKTVGYELQYSLDKTFLTGKKTVKITNVATVKKSVTKLTSKKSYYVRMRAYNKSGSTVIYSPWTTVKNPVKTK